MSFFFSSEHHLCFIDAAVLYAGKILAMTMVVAAVHLLSSLVLGSTVLRFYDRSLIGVKTCVRALTLLVPEDHQEESGIVGDSLAKVLVGKMVNPCITFLLPHRTSLR